MPHKFCLDTNVLWNEKGGEAIKFDELHKFSVYGNILLPEIILEELEQKQIRKFNKEKSEFKSTKISKLVDNNVDEYNINQNFQQLKDNLLGNNKIEIIKLEDFSVLPEMKDLAVSKQPPFEPGEDTDKGFKDCYIFFTLKEYIKNNPNVEVFFYTKDKRLKESIYNDINIKTVDGLDDYIKNYGFSDYQKQNIANMFNVPPENVSCTTIVNNINDNKVLGIIIKDNSGQEHYCRFEIDNGEIIDSIDEDFVLGSEYSIEDTINDFVNSGSFQETHLGVHRLMSILQYLYNDELIRILNAAIDNKQISQIISDDDVYHLILLIYNSKHDILDNELAGKYQEIITEIETTKDTDELPF